MQKQHHHTSVPTIPKIPFLLAFIAIIPLIVAAFGLKYFPDSYDWKHFFVSFCVIISAFLGGIHWGFATIHYHKKGPLPKRLILWSNIIALGSLIALLTKSFNIAILIVFTILMVQWIVDSLILSDEIIPSWFKQIRNVMSAMIMIVFIFVLLTH
jgi:hypothetical protein